MKPSTFLSAAVTCALVIASGSARASSPTTCTYPGTNGSATVQVDGRPTTIDVSPVGVLVNGMFCGEPDQLETIYVYGGALADQVTISGQLVPGASPETDYDELEVYVDLGAGSDTITLSLSDGSDSVRCRDSGEVGLVELNPDSDSDVDLRQVENLELMGNGGNDVIDAQLYDGTIVIDIDGGPGDDAIVGTPGADQIDGGNGNDTLLGFYGDDVLIGGAGSDILRGEDGMDTVDYRARTAPVTVTIGNGVADDGEAGEQDDVRPDVERVLGGKGKDVLIGGIGNDTLDGGIGNDTLDGGLGLDVLIGGAGTDTVDYSSRTGDLNVTIGNGFADDGELFEFDRVDITVESVTGGSGNDTLVGSTSANTLRGGAGNDNLQGGDGNDKLYGDAGDDTLIGDAGADNLYGSGGADVLDGGADADVYTAGAGNDFLYNDDGVAETVNCGPGNADDAEVDTGATDTFVGCEL